MAALPTASRARRLVRPKWLPVASPTGYVAARVLLACGAALAVASLVALLDERRALVPLAACAVACGAVGATLRAACAAPAALRIVAIHVAVLASWLLLLVVGTVTYLVCGTFDRVDHALIESTSGFTTTALSVLGDVDETPKGVLLWRASTQWMGGLAAVLVIVAVLPVLGVGGIEGGTTSAERRSLRLRSPHIVATTRRLVAGYLVLSAAGVVLFAGAGLGPFDAVTYAMTTISTGGFGNHEGSIAYFDSSLVEWVTVGGMVLGGTNLVLVLSAARGRVGPLWRSTELRAYLASLAIGAILVVWGTVPAGGLTHESVRHGVFAVSSAVSTTGHTVGVWAAWPPGPLVLLILLAGVGAMSGAAGGGFRIVRALTLLGVVRREVVRQIQPRSVVAVKLGRTPVDEGLVSHMIGYQVGWLLLAGAGAAALGAVGVDMAGSITGAVTALATFGPALGDLSFGVADRPTSELLVLAPLMLAGRLEITPVVVGAVSLLGATSRRWLRRGRRR